MPDDEGISAEIDANLAPTSPAPGADDHKPTGPAPAADDENAETQETPEQQAEKKESRRARQNARRAAELAEAKTEARLLREQLAEIKAKSAPVSDEPKREDFQDDASFLRAVWKYDAKQEANAAIKPHLEALESRQKQSQQTDGNTELAKNWTQREAAFQKATKDYEDVVTPFAEEELQDFDMQARRAIVESEKGPETLYYLATHADEAARIAKLSPLRQVAELGKLEDRLTKVVKASNAPPPIKPVGSGRAGNSDPSRMSDSEYKAWRKSQGARWAQG